MTTEMSTNTEIDNMAVSVLDDIDVSMGIHDFNQLKNTSDNQQSLGKLMSVDFEHNLIKVFDGFSGFKMNSIKDKVILVEDNLHVLNFKSRNKRLYYELDCVNCTIVSQDVLKSKWNEIIYKG